MAKVRVKERHFDSTRDFDGAVRYAFITETESEEFQKYMENFHVWEKYRRNRFSQTRSHVIKGELQWLTADAYFSGWVPTHMANHELRNEMCYIIVTEIHSIREN